MSITDRLRGPSRNLPSTGSYRLTESGKEKLQEFAGDPKSRILVALETRGTSDIKEISDASGLSRGKVERLIPTLVRAGYVSYVSASSGGDDY